MKTQSLNRLLVRKSAYIVAGIALIEALVLIIFHGIFLPPVLQNVGRVPWFGWFAAVLVAIAYIWYAAYGLPTVRRLLFTVTPVAVLGLVLAVPSSVLEEVFFRQALMNAHRSWPIVAQIGYSAILFGVVHGVGAFEGGGAAFWAQLDRRLVSELASRVFFFWRLAWSCHASWRIFSST